MYISKLQHIDYICAKNNLKISKLYYELCEHIYSNNVLFLEDSGDENFLKRFWKWLMDIIDRFLEWIGSLFSSRLPSIFSAELKDADFYKKAKEYKIKIIKSVKVKDLSLEVEFKDDATLVEAINNYGNILEMFRNTKSVKKTIDEKIKQVVVNLQGTGLTPEQTTTEKNIKDSLTILANKFVSSSNELRLLTTNIRTAIDQIKAGTTSVPSTPTPPTPIP